jgi:hypothetical protein
MYLIDAVGYYVPRSYVIIMHAMNTDNNLLMDIPYPLTY